MYPLEWFNNPKLFRRLVNLWPPLWGAGISVREVSDDWMHAQVRLSLRFYNRNFVGTQYGGSLFSMTDLMYMLMLLHHIGREHVVWDKQAEIDFIKPGRGPVYARFDLDQSRIDKIVSDASDNRKLLEEFNVDIVDSDDAIIARVKRIIYVRRKPPKDKGESQETLHPPADEKTESRSTPMEIS